MKQMIFDGHNDVLSKLSKLGGPDQADAFQTGLPGQLDAAKAQAGGFGGGFFALWARSDMSLEQLDAVPRHPTYDFPLPPPLTQADAWQMIKAQADILLHLNASGAVVMCTSVDMIQAARADGKIAAIFHVEGADCIGSDLAGLDTLYDMGLRSLGLVWSRPTIFGQGVPFRYPSDGDIGAGLSDAGRALVARCNALKVLIDLSHLNAAGVRDVAEISDAPLVATHSNPHAVAPHARNLTDDQLTMIAGSGGVAGLNFETTFLRPDGRPNREVPTDMVMRHLDYMLQHLGEEGVVIGSDYDGCSPPLWLYSANKLPALVQAMQAHGYRDDRIERICWSNWMRVLRDTWGG